MKDHRKPAVMLQGTGSDVGKSLLVAGLARAYSRRGLTVRPFKPQNMSNNAAVTPDGGEIGRAQALQARACGVQPDVHMNPILLKPQTDMGSQVVVQGRVLTAAKARDYYKLKSQLLPKVLESFEKISQEADLVLIEGAGSPAEVNLRAGDIANMGFAEAADVPVVLVADIERGGVIASLVGTHQVLEAEERDRLKGYVINKFRGDVTLFDSALEIIQDHTGLNSLGVLPWFAGAGKLPAEDAVALEKEASHWRDGSDPIRIAVPRIGRIANFDDLDPLKAEPGVSVTFVPQGQPLPGDAELILLPGSKATISDLKFFREQGWDIDLAAHIRRGGRVVGLCAGYQMMGRTISDPDGIEGPPETVEGLGLLPVDTVLGGDKALYEATGTDHTTGAQVTGYEMHMGRTQGEGLTRPMLDLDGRPDGAISEDGLVMGCYLHGIFAADDFRSRFLNQFRSGLETGLAYEHQVETTLDDLADHLEAHMDLDALLEIARAR